MTSLNDTRQKQRSSKVQDRMWLCLEQESLMKVVIWKESTGIYCHYTVLHVKKNYTWTRKPRLTKCRVIYFANINSESISSMSATSSQKSAHDQTQHIIALELGASSSGHLTQVSYRLTEEHLETLCYLFHSEPVQNASSSSQECSRRDEA